MPASRADSTGSRRSPATMPSPSPASAKVWLGPADDQPGYNVLLVADSKKNQGKPRKTKPNQIRKRVGFPCISLESLGFPCGIPRFSMGYSDVSRRIFSALLFPSPTVSERAYQFRRPG